MGFQDLEKVEISTGQVDGQARPGLGAGAPMGVPAQGSLTLRFLPELPVDDVSIGEMDWRLLPEDDAVAQEVSAGVLLSRGQEIVALAIDAGRAVLVLG